MQDMVDQPVRQVIQNIHDLLILLGLITFILLMLIYKIFWVKIFLYWMDSIYASSSVKCFTV